MEKIYLDELQKYVEQIDTRTYHDYKIDVKYFCGKCIYTRSNEMRMTCSALYQGQFLQMRKLFIYL